MKNAGMTSYGYMGYVHFLTNFSDIVQIPFYQFISGKIFTQTGETSREVFPCKGQEAPFLGYVLLKSSNKMIKLIVNRLY